VASDVWTVDSRLEPPSDELKVDGFGVGHRADVERRELLVRTDDLFNLQVTTRKCLRDAMVGACEARGYTMLHASAVDDDSSVIIFAGDSGSGKTTLALSAVLEHQYHYLANDHLIVYRDESGGGGTVLTSLPTLIPVRVGTYWDLEAQLPRPMLLEDGTDDRWRDTRSPERYARTETLFYTYPQLGQANPVTVRLPSSRGRLQIAVVFPAYAEFDRPNGRPEPLASAWPELGTHIRLDWPFDPQLNRRYLPRSQRTPDRYLADGRQLAKDLAQKAIGFRWSHRGDVGPLLEALGEQPESRA
jgi:hypothetical protein